MKLKFLPKIDKYIAGQYLVLYALCFASLVGLVCVGDLFQKTDEFANYAEKSDEGVWVVIYLIIQYYAAFAPGMVLRWLLPVVSVVAAVITATAGCVHNEFTVFRSSGISIKRALLAIIIPTLFIGYASNICRDTYLPYLIRQGHKISSKIRPKSAQPLSLVLRDDKQTQSVSMGHFDQNGIAHNLRIESRDSKNYYTDSETVRIYSAREAALQPRISDKSDSKHELQWNPIAGGLLQDNKPYRRDEEVWSDPLPTFVTPAMLERQILGQAVMTWEDLKLLEDEELDARLEMYKRRSEPYGAVVIIVLALALVLRKSIHGSEPSYVKNIVGGFLVCAAFYLLRLGFISMGETGALHPLLAAWAPVIIFGGLGGFLYWRMEN